MMNFTVRSAFDTIAVLSVAIDLLSDYTLRFIFYLDQ